jgi:hypothetical protein
LAYLNGSYFEGKQAWAAVGVNGVTQMKDEHQVYRELIRATLNTRPGRVQLGPLEAARSGRQLLTYSRANTLAGLEVDGLVTLAAGKDRKMATIRLTEAGRAVILAMPDDVGAEYFPRPVDIAKAKAKLSKVTG